MQRNMKASSAAFGLSARNFGLSEVFGRARINSSESEVSSPIRRKAVRGNTSIRCCSIIARKLPMLKTRTPLLHVKIVESLPAGDSEDIPVARAPDAKSFPDR